MGLSIGEKTPKVVGFLYLGPQQFVLIMRRISERTLANRLLLSSRLFILDFYRFMLSRDYGGRTDYLIIPIHGMSGARGGITAFARPLVSEPCQALAPNWRVDVNLRTPAG